MVVVDLLDLAVVVVLVVSLGAPATTWAIHLQWLQAILMLWEIKVAQWYLEEGWWTQ